MRSTAWHVSWIETNIVDQAHDRHIDQGRFGQEVDLDRHQETTADHPGRVGCSPVRMDLGTKLRYWKLVPDARPLLTPVWLATTTNARLVQHCARRRRHRHHRRLRLRCHSYSCSCCSCSSNSCTYCSINHIQANCGISLTHSLSAQIDQ
jgi:hypothetical protein